MTQMETPGPVRSRRRLLRRAAGVALGGVGAGAVVGVEPAAAVEVDDGSVTPDSFHPTAVDPSAAVPGARTLGTGPNQAAAGITVRSVRARDIDPHDHGSVAADGTGGKQALIAALVDAEAKGGSGVIRLRPCQVYDVGDGLSLAGFSSTIVGAGSAWSTSSGQPAGSRIRASTQKGPVIDFEGFRYPSAHRGRLPFGAISVEGSGQADSTQARSGLSIGSPGEAGTPTSAKGIHFFDMVVANTGGPCLDLGLVYLCDFAGITLSTPVAAATNDVAYFRSRGANCNIFSRIGFRSVGQSNQVGRSGAAVISASPTFPSENNCYDAWWFEYINPLDGGTIFSLSSNASIVRDFQFVDCAKSSGRGPEGRSNTSFMRLLPSPMADYGGNEIRGLIPGRSGVDDAGTTTGIDVGVDVLQSYNAIRGVRGYRNHIGRIWPGVKGTVFDLAGSLSGPALPTVTDASGNDTNVIRDSSFGDSEHTLADGGELPPASAAHRGKERLVMGSGSTPDRVYRCLRGASGAYSWVVVSEG